MRAVSFQIVLGPVEFVPETDSTNRALLERARLGAPHGVVLVAGHQTAGRGRLDRRWEAPPGSSLLVSVLLRPARLDQPVTVHEAPLLTFAAALAAAEACRRVAGVEAAVKWPNDLLVGDRKVAGLLAESVVEGCDLAAVVVGMGLNVNWPSPMPAGLAATATSLNHEAGAGVDAAALLDAWLAAYDRRLGALGEVPGEYRACCATLGRTVRATLPGDEVVEGVAASVDDRGRLVVAGRPLSVADVVHLRPA